MEVSSYVDSVYCNRPVPFLTNRLLRIVPHFLLAVALSMLAHEFFRLAGGVRLWRSQPRFPDDAFALSNVLLNFLSILPMGRRVLDYDFLTITWAVRVEMAFYLTMFCCILIGRRLPWPRGFAVVASGLLVLLLLLSYPIIHGKHGPEMLGSAPYFAFGGGLYFATAGSRTGLLTVLASVPVMLWQFIESQIRMAPIQGIPVSVAGNLIIFIALLSSMAALAFVSIVKGRAIDRTLGDLTYPLYLYHEDVLVVILTATMGYAYSTLAIGFLLSFATAAVLMWLVDPAVTLYRNRVRGRALREVHGKVSYSSSPGHASSGLRLRSRKSH
jgi:peptidoglycan/LPS O-acetylase OafA/YrhL